MEKPKALAKEDIEAKLRDLPGWMFVEDKIKKEFRFDDFMDALGFINRLASFFENNDHHPDIRISYNKVIFELQRFDIGGKVTELDFETATKIEEEYGEKKKAV